MLNPFFSGKKVYFRPMAFCGLLKHFLSLTLLLALLASCNSKKEEFGNTDSGSGTSTLGDSISANTKVPLLVVRVQFANVTFQSDATTWANKIFGTSDGQLNHYFSETTYSNYAFTPVTETDGTANDGIITVTLSGNHPDTRKNTFSCYASTAIQATDSYINFASYDSDSNSKLSRTEMQVMFLVAGGESASSINTPGGVWGLFTSMYCDADSSGSVSLAHGEGYVELDGVQMMASSTYSMNGYSQFGERQGSSASDTWDATIGIIAHELGHAYFDLPDLYCTSGSCKGIGNFGLMGGGSWGRKSSSEKSGDTPVHFSAWSKEKTSVCTPQTAASGTNSYTLSAMYLSSNSSSCGIYKITTSASDEYFLLENRSIGGYDQGFYYGLVYASGGTDYAVGTSFTGGLAIWHIKDIVSSCRSNNNCQTQSPKLADLEEANDGDLDSGGSSGRKTNLFYSGNSTTFGDSSTPNSKLSGGTATNISVSSISAAGDSMTLSITK